MNIASIGIDLGKTTFHLFPTATTTKMTESSTKGNRPGATH